MRLQLETYQEDMRDFLLANPIAYCMVGLGLGKTASTLMALNELFADGAIRSALIVAPLRVARLTWPNEIRKWEQFRWMDVEQLKGDPKTKAQIYCINYEQLPNLTTTSFADVVVLDEITRAKNHKSSRIKHLREHLRDRQWKWGLTGTPRPNSLLEIFGQIRVLDSGKRLGAAYTGFRDRFFYPTDYMRYNWELRPDAEKEIYGRIADISLTLRSEDHLDIPETEVIDSVVKLDVKSQKLYREMEREYLTYVNGSEVVAANAAVMVNKLLQICGGAVYQADRTVSRIHEHKIVRLKEIIKEAKEPVIVACQYQHETDRICDLVKGATKVSDVKGNLEDEWNQGRIPVLVSHPASLGHGLNLQQGGRTIIWFSPTWSRELYDQFNARVARKGQDRVPRIYRILVSDTIDDVVVETLRERGDEQSAMLRIMKNYQAMRGKP